MASGCGALDVHLRALEGFPDERDCGFGRSDHSAAILELVVRLIPPNDSAADARFLCLRRSLADFVHLETRVSAESESYERAGRATNIAQTIERYSQALERPRFGSIASETERLLVQLEMALTSLLVSPSRQSAAVKQFFGHEAVDVAKAKLVVEKCLQPGEAIEEDAIVSGDSAQHHVDVDGGNIVVWKFAFAGDAVDFSVVYAPNTEDDFAAEADEEESKDDGDTEQVDPYSEAAWNASEDDHSPPQTTDRVVLQYSTRHVRPANAEEDAWVYGACRVPHNARGVVTLTWADAGDASIFAKPLRFQTHVCKASDNDDGVTFQDEWTVVDGVEDDGEAGDSLGWLEAMVEASPATAWPKMSSDDGVPLDTDLRSDPARDTFASEATRLKEVKILELQSKVFQLEEELLAVRQELKTTKSELEISSEIYKASLETIAHLETTPARMGGPSGRRASLDDAPPRDSLGSIDEGDEEKDDDSYGEDEVGLESEDEEADVDADGETHRLRDLVATFQEQCLWRSIETSESEKRNLLLEAELQRLDRDKQSLTDQLTARDQEATTLHAENQKLKAQKAVLVKEVKRLQPYTQVNLSALIREAEEARMMQRSLQAQLQELLAGKSPETDHPVSQAAATNSE